ncbi:MAG: hypothetical protein WB762_04360 [Candidatus Sulfotelmatobacter sp.]
MSSAGAGGIDITALRKEAESGSYVARSILGVSYLDGIDVEVNYHEAFQFLSAAANQGPSRAVVNLARMYAEGWGVRTDVNAAVMLYQSVSKSEFLALIALAAFAHAQLKSVSILRRRAGGTRQPSSGNGVLRIASKQGSKGLGGKDVSCSGREAWFLADSPRLGVTSSKPFHKGTSGRKSVQGGEL